MENQEQQQPQAQPAEVKPKKPQRISPRRNQDNFGGTYIIHYALLRSGSKKRFQRFYDKLLLWEKQQAVGGGEEMQVKVQEEGFDAGQQPEQQQPPNN